MTDIFRTMRSGNSYEQSVMTFTAAKPHLLYGLTLISYQILANHSSLLCQMPADNYLVFLLYAAHN